MSSASPAIADLRPLLWTAAVSGAFAQLAQVLVLREIMAVYHGSEMLFGVVFAGTLAWTAAGIFLGTTLAKKRVRTGKPLAGLLAVLMAGSGLVLALQIVLVRVAAGWQAHAAGEAVPLGQAAALSLLVCAPGAALAGAQFALVLRGSAAAGFSPAYRAEAWGTVLAGLAVTFVLVHLAGAMRIALVAGGLGALAAGWVLRPQSGWSRAGVGGLAAASLLLAFLPLERSTEELCWRGRLPGYELLQTRDTPYGRVAALRHPQGKQVSLFHNGAIAASFEPDTPLGPTRQWADLCAALGPAPRRALLVGGALGTLPEELLRHDLEQVDAVELDPALFELAAQYESPSTKSAAVRHLAVDGRWFVRQVPAGTYDRIVVNMGEPDTVMVNRYYTLEFFQQCRRALSASGVLVCLLPTYGGGTDYTGEALARRSASIWRALGDVFGDVRAAPIGGCLLAAAIHPGIIDLLPAALGRRLAAHPATLPAVPVETDGRVERVPVSPEDYFDGLFGGVLAVRQSLDGAPRQERMAAWEDLLAATDVPVNRDVHPAAVTESLVLEGQLSGGTSSALCFGTLLSRGGPWFAGVPIAAAVGLCLLGLLRTHGRRVGASSQLPRLLAPLATGVFGMAVQVTLLVAYQNARGYVYQEIGVLTACFMVGLALGASSAHPWLGNRRRRFTLAVGAMILLVLALPDLCTWMAALPGTLLAAGAFWLLSLATGLVDGLVLAALAGAAAEPHHPRFFAWLYACDLIGAAVGALFCGAVWIPLYGLTGGSSILAVILAMLTVSALLPWGRPAVCGQPPSAQEGT